MFSSIAQGLVFLFLLLACYGVLPQTSTLPWVCQRCQANVSHSQDCCLCLLRGGALKPTDGGRWAHLVCAVTIPDVYLGDLRTRQPVVTEDITRARRKLVSPHSIRMFGFNCLNNCRDAHSVCPCQKRFQCVDMVYVFSVSTQSVALQCMSLVLITTGCLM